MCHQVRRPLRNAEPGQTSGAMHTIWKVRRRSLDLIAAYLIEHHPDREVDAVSQEFNIGGYAELHLQVRMPLEKIRKGRRRMRLVERWRRYDAKTTAEFSRTEVAFDDVIELIENGPALLV